MEVPLCVFVNTKSGGLQGTKILDKFKKCVPPENVFDLSNGGPAQGLQKFGGQKFRIVVCGGDGSVGWVLTEVEKLKFPKELVPPVAILPIGTGNDLSRVLKWGGSHNATKLNSFVSKIEKACVVMLDKWELSYTGEGPLPHARHIMHNYFSVGADASIALQFHEMRLAHPEKFSSRAQNLAWYVRLGLHNLSPVLLSPHVSVEINGQKVALPDNTKCVVVLNLPSYSGGGNPWGTKKSTRRTFATPAIDDGLLEVVAVNGPLQLVGIHANIIRGKRLGQGSQVKITNTKQIAAQVDGEPWNQPPSVINIQLSGKSHMLANSLPSADPASVEAVPQASSSSSDRTGTIRGNLVRTRSSSAPIMENTPSPLHYGPVQPEKRKKNRLYCDACGLEFYLPYMLANHNKSGLCAAAPSSSGTSKPLEPEAPPATISVQVGDAESTTDVLSVSGEDESWRRHSAELSPKEANEADGASPVPWRSSSKQNIAIKQVEQKEETADVSPSASPFSPRRRNSKPQEHTHHEHEHSHGPHEHSNENHDNTNTEHKEPDNEEQQNAKNNQDFDLHVHAHELREYNNELANKPDFESPPPTPTEPAPISQSPPSNSPPHTEDIKEQKEQTENVEA